MRTCAVSTTLDDESKVYCLLRSQTQVFECLTKVGRFRNNLEPSVVKVYYTGTEHSTYMDEL